MKLLRLLTLFVMLSIAGQLAAATILPPKSAWEYSADGSTWFPGLAPFGNSFGDPNFGPNTYWAAGTDIQVRTKIDLSGFNLSTIKWDLGVDNGFDLYANGNFVAGANAEGFTFRWEYSGTFSPLALFGGVNTILVKLEDHGGLTAFDMQITGDRLSSVPDSGLTAGMLAAALLGLAAVRSRFRR